MGTVDIFNENANLTGLLESYANVRKIVHKAFIEFDEGGSDGRNAGIESERNPFYLPNKTVLTHSYSMHLQVCLTFRVAAFHTNLSESIVHSCIFWWTIRIMLFSADELKGIQMQ